MIGLTGRKFVMFLSLLQCLLNTYYFFIIYYFTNIKHYKHLPIATIKKNLLLLDSFY